MKKESEPPSPPLRLWSKGSSKSNQWQYTEGAAMICSLGVGRQASTSANYLDLLTSFHIGKFHKARTSRLCL